MSSIKAVSAFVADRSAASLKDLMLIIRKTSKDGKLDELDEILSSISLPSLTKSLRDNYLLRSQQRQSVATREAQELQNSAAPYSVELIAYLLEREKISYDDTVIALFFEEQGGWDFISMVVYPLASSKLDWHIVAVLRLLKAIVNRSNTASHIYRSVNWESFSKICGKREPTSAGFSVRQMWVCLTTRFLEILPAKDIPDLFRNRNLLTSTIRGLEKDGWDEVGAFIRALSERLDGKEEISRYAKSSWIDSSALSVLAKIAAAPRGLNGEQHEVPALTEKMLIMIISLRSSDCLFPIEGDRVDSLLGDFVKSFKLSSNIVVYTKLIEACLEGRPSVARIFFEKSAMTLSGSRHRFLGICWSFTRIFTAANGVGSNFQVFNKTDLSKAIGADSGLLSQFWGLRLLASILEDNRNQSIATASVPDLSYVVSLLNPILKGAFTAEKFIVLVQWVKVIEAYKKNRLIAFRQFRYDWGAKLLEKASGLPNEAQIVLIQLSAKVISSLKETVTLLKSIVKSFDWQSVEIIDSIECALVTTGIFKDPALWLHYIRQDEAGTKAMNWFIKVLSKVAENPLKYFQGDQTAVFINAATTCPSKFGHIIDKVENRIQKRSKRQKIDAPVLTVVPTVVSKSVIYDERADTSISDQLLTISTKLSSADDLRSFLLEYSQSLIIGISDNDDSTRSKAFEILGEVSGRVFAEEETENKRFAFREVPQISLLFRVLRNSIPAPADGQQIPGSVPLNITAFASSALHVLLKPEHPAYKKVFDYITSHTSISSSDVPCWKECFLSDSVSDSRQIRLWVMRIVSRAAVDRRCVSLFERLGIIDSLLTLGTCSVSDRGAVAIAITFIRNCLKALKDEPKGLNKFVRRYGVVSWLEALTQGKHIRDEDQL